MSNSKLTASFTNSPFYIIFSLIVLFHAVNTNFFQLQKIKQLKRNMVCKYKFVLMYNKYNLYFDSFTKEYPLILSSLNLNQTRDLLDFG